MFTFDKENPSKIVATSLLPIEPDWRCNPLVWTAELKPVQTRRVFIVCSVTRAGKQSFRFYNLRKDPAKPPPAFVVVPNDSKWLKDPLTHVCYRHSRFSIIRPLKAVFYKTKFALKRGDMDWLPANLLTLVKHCYFHNVIGDNFIDKIEQKFDRIDKMIARAMSSNFDAEVDACVRQAYNLSASIFKIITQRLDEKGF